MSRQIYCISGLGADERIFTNLHIPGTELKFVQWIQPQRDESFQSYARRLHQQIDDENPVLLGVSFGGIMALELAKQFPVKQVFLISSVKSGKEMPWWMKTVGKLRLHRLIRPRPHPVFYPIENYYLGAKTKEEKQIAEQYRGRVDQQYLQWALHGILTWNNEVLLSNIIHIHGSRDHIFPAKKLEHVHIIENAGHFMVYNKGAEVSRLIEQLLV
jgi:pimeloyl-ACP methyl ester carboxylesterase